MRNASGQLAHTFELLVSKCLLLRALYLGDIDARANVADESPVGREARNGSDDALLCRRRVDGDEPSVRQRRRRASRQLSRVALPRAQELTSNTASIW